MKNDARLGILFTVTGAFLWSLNAPLVKSIDMDPYMLSAMRALIAGVVMLPFVRPKKMVWNIFTLFMFLSFAVQCTLIVLALKLTSAPIATGMQFTAPIWLYLIERKKGEPLRMARLWPLAVLLCGIVLFMCSRGGGATLAGNLCALATSFTFAGVTYFSKKAMGDNPVGATSLCCLFLAFSVLAIFVPNPVRAIVSIPAATWPLLLFLGIVQYGGGYAFYNMGVKRISGKTAAMLSPIEMVLGPVWVAIFLHEYTDAIGLAAFAIVIAGVVSEVVVSNREAEGTLYAPRARLPRVSHTH